MSDDDVTDYMVLEAVALKAMQAERDAEKNAEVAEWKQDTQSLRERAEA